MKNMDLETLTYFTRNFCLPMIIFDKTGRVILANKSFEVFTGYPLADIEGKPFDEIFMNNKNNFLELFSNIDDMVNKESDISYITEFLKKDGAISYGEVNFSILMDKENNYFAQAVITDITKRKKLEEALKDSEEKRRRIIETVNAGIVIIQDHKIIFANEKLTQIFGYSNNELIDKPFDAFIYPDEAPKIKEMYINRMNRENVPSVYETAVLHKNGKKIEVEVNANIIQYLGHNADFVFIRDITKQKRIEEALLEGDETFRMINSSAQDAIILIDNDQKVSYWNKAAEIMFGYTQEEIFGLNIHLIIAPEKYREIALSAFKKFRNTGTGNAIGKTTELSGKRKDGTEFPIELSLSAFKRKGKWNAVGIVRDITKRKMDEQKTKDINKELSHFIYAASHDMREPLRMVICYLQLLEKRYKGKLDKDADDFINFAVDGAKRMNNMIVRLLEYSRLETRKQPFELLDGNDIIKQTLNNLKISIEETQAKITYKNIPHFMGDKPQIISLLQNLIINAINYRKKNTPPEIKIAASIHKDNNQRDDFIEFSIQDNGIGIDPKYHDKIFEIFQRLHTKQNYPGDGVGLCLCRKIAQRHGGSIRVESKLGKGATFYFTISLKLNSQAETRWRFQ